MNPLTLRDFSAEEICSILLVVYMDMDPRQKSWWGRAEPLFTIEAPDGRPTMHPETLRAVQEVFAREGTKLQ